MGVVGVGWGGIIRVRRRWVGWWVLGVVGGDNKGEASVGVGWVGGGWTGRERDRDREREREKER